MANNALDDQTAADTQSPDEGKDEKADVKGWLRTLSNAERWRDQTGQKAGWSRFLREFGGDWQWLQEKVKIPLVPINLVYAYTKTEIARLYFRDPWITINPKRKEDIGAAQIAEQVINYMWGELKLKSEIKKVLTELIVVGHSWIKVGYVAEFGTVESQPPPPPAPRGPGRPKKEKAVIDTSEYLKSENAFAYYVSYKDVIFDPSATFPAPHNARWMAHKITKPLRAVKKSGLYKHTDELRPSKVLDDNGDISKSPGDMDETVNGKDVQNVTFYEIYDLDEMKVTTVSPGCEYKMRETGYPDYLNGELPFVQFAFNFIPGEVYPQSDISSQEPQIIELIKMQAIELNHLKRWNRQIITKPEFFTKEEQDKFKDGNDGAIIQGNVGAGDSLQNAFYIPPYAPVQQDIYGVWNQVMDIWKNVCGQSGTERGANEKNPTRTLGELRLQLQGGRARADEKMDMLEDSIESVARKLLKIMQTRFDLPKIARIVGDDTIKEKVQASVANRPSAQPNFPNGQQNPVAEQSMTSDFSFTWNRNDLMGDMDVDVVAGSTAPMDKEAQIEMMDQMVPAFPMFGITPGSPAAIAAGREYLRLVGIKSLEGILDIAEKTPKQPDPEMAKAQMEAQAEQQQAQMDAQAKQQDMAIKQQEAQMKIQTQAQLQQIKVQAAQDKLAFEQKKNEMDIQKSVIQAALAASRPKLTNGSNGNGNGE